jgi:hypothetical protein
MDVFVSSTVKDLDTYRDRIAEALSNAAISCQLSKNWVSSYESTLKKVRQELRESNGYYGIFAHYYGSIPPGSKESITALEFRWAMGLFGNKRPPPMAVFIPAPKSAADGDLQEKADMALAEAFPNQLQEQERHRQLQREFRQRVMSPPNEWRPVTYFRDREHLGDLAIAMHGVWVKELILAAGGGALGDPGDEPTPEQLGRLGRGDHLAAAGKAITVAAARKAAALCLLVAGQEDAGQVELSRALVADVLKNRFRIADARRPPFDSYRLEDVVRWMGSVVGGEEVTTIEALAALISRVTKARPVALIIDPIDSFDGGLPAFHAQLWEPLAAALEARVPDRRPCFALLAIAYAEAAPSRVVELATGAQSAARLDKLFMLSPLGSIEELDVMGWLADEQVPDPSGTRHNEIAAAVVRNPAGALDGTPRRVFERLKRRGLWSQGAD